VGAEGLTTQTSGLEHNASVATGPIPESPLGLALSGGGGRAALFSLGVIVALIETQYHKRVACIASVSGGSILNAALAHSGRLGELTSVDDFKPLVASLTTILAERGTFVLSWRNVSKGAWYVLQFGSRALTALVPAALFGFAMLSDQLRQDYNVDLPPLLVAAYRQVPWVPTAAIAVVCLLVMIVYSRGLFQEAVYRDVVKAGIASRADHAKITHQLRNWGAQADGDAPEVMHVLVATDLLSGEPMYFSGDFVYCRRYGWSPPMKLLSTEALYSSAAFPVVFPPKKLRLSRLTFRGGEMQGDLPRGVRLADGGVYNNLGNDWFKVLATESSRASRGTIKPCGGLAVARLPRIAAENIIVVNAGAPSRSVRRLLPGPFAISRIMSVLYDNTVRPRVELLRHENRHLIDIAQSPLELAESLQDLEGSGGSRAKELADKLSAEWPRRFWDDFSQDTASTPTKLSSTKRRRGVRLVLHGYLSALVLLYIKFGVTLPEHLRDEGDFLALADLGVASESAAD
jgi:predicted acylesterase/phospholipase RssA